MVVFPNAKINIGLNVTSRRNDGFHNIASVFYPVGWKDVLELLPGTSLGFCASGIEIGGEISDNLCMKIYSRLQKEFQLPPVQIHLHKNIPVGAGLGGGSADAAFAVKMMNKMFSLGFKEGTMIDIVKDFGSDCAFFIKNVPVFVSGKGDQMAEVNINLKGMHLLIVYPDLFISTREAYEGIIPLQRDVSVAEIIKLPVHQWKDLLKNDFEDALFIKYPLLMSLKAQLYSMNAVYASMSGSGSSMYAIFESDPLIKGAFPSTYRVWKEKLAI
jgi:4-diphosphocytidyl-2-C-methyl-D-erythritol kinase